MHALGNVSLMNNKSNKDNMKHKKVTVFLQGLIVTKSYRQFMTIKLTL